MADPAAGKHAQRPRCIRTVYASNAMNRTREMRLIELKERIDAVHEVVLRALRAHDEPTIDRAMEEQHLLLQEYRTLVREKGKQTT
jgi:hypothetical protein